MDKQRGEFFLPEASTETKLDWRFLFRKIDSDFKHKHKGTILTFNEVSHYSTMLKEIAITEENLSGDID